MARGFVYLAVVLDWATRRVLSWRLSITMEAAFCVETLEDALARHGKLTPILDDGHVPAGGICIEDLARLWAGLRDRQRKRLTYEAIAFKFATVPLIARLICNISRSLNARSPTDQT
jgi:hypothetical protein